MRWFSLLLLAGLLGCSSPAERKINVVNPHPSIHETGGASYLGVPLSSGQIVLSDRASALSLLMTVGLAQYRPYTHAGILVVEEGVPYVYEQEGVLQPHLGGSPTEAIHGGVRRRSFENVIQQERVVAVYEPPPGTHPGRMVTFSWKSFLSDLDFDSYFDYDDHSRLYCTEFVAVAVQQAGGRPPDPIPLRGNPSLDVALRWLKIRAPHILAAGSFAVPERHVATFSRIWSEAEVAAYFAARREIHRRFTADQRLGHLFRWENNRLKLRPEVIEFQKQALALASNVALADHPETVDTDIRNLADLFFTRRPQAKGGSSNSTWASGNPFP